MIPEDLHDRARALLADFRLPAGGGSSLAPWLGEKALDQRGIGRLLDHTLVRADATKRDIHRHCQEAVAIGAVAVCVNGSWVSACTERLWGSKVKVSSVVGFPLGAMTGVAKAAEARLAIADGAAEIEVVMAIGEALAGEWEHIDEEIEAVVQAAQGRTVKVILEAAALDSEAVVKACLVACAAGAQFVKTSTGFDRRGGATVETVALMRHAVGMDAGVKASGGIRTCADALRMVAAGANRIGTSSALSLKACVGAGAPTLGELLANAPAVSA